MKNRWRVESSKVKFGDLIVKYIREEFKVNTKMAKELNKAHKSPVNVLNSLGYKVYRLPKRGKKR